MEWQCKRPNKLSYYIHAQKMLKQTIQGIWNHDLACHKYQAWGVLPSSGVSGKGLASLSEDPAELLARPSVPRSCSSSWQFKSSRIDPVVCCTVLHAGGALGALAGTPSWHQRTLSASESFLSILYKLQHQPDSKWKPHPTDCNSGSVHSHSYLLCTPSASTDTEA